MTPTRWRGFFTRFASAAALLLALAALALQGPHADACSGGYPGALSVTTFDQGALGQDWWRGLHFDPDLAGYGDACAGDCALALMVSDWQGYLKRSGLGTEAVAHAVKDAPAGELAAVSSWLADPAGDVPPGYEQSAIRRAPAATRARLRGAFAYLELARAVEPFTRAVYRDGELATAGPPPSELLAAARNGLAAAPDRFLRQRYAFLVAKLLFHAHDWPALIDFVDATSALGGPSQDLRWRARWYLAGALRRIGERARANLELARMGAGYPPLASAASQDFQPLEEADWRLALRLAANARERAMLWRLLGIKFDGLAAIREIRKLHPSSDAIPLLLVRELARAELLAYGNDLREIPPDPAGRDKALAALEPLAAELAGVPRGDRPWLLELVAGHVAALRGDLPAARSHLSRARELRPGDARVAQQAQMSLALALVHDWKIGAEAEEELVRTLTPLPLTTRAGTTSRT